MADNSKDVEKQVAQLREWINSQPHLPKNLDDKLLRRFLHSCYYNFEKAKNSAELFFSIRASAPDLFHNRDPRSPEMRKTFDIVKLARYRIAGDRNLWIWQLNDPGLEHYDYLQDARLFMLTTDAWLLDDDYLEESDIVVMDVKDITLKFITKFNLSIARKLSKYQEDAMPIRLKQIHIINAPSFIDKIYGLMKPFLKQDMTNMIHFHPPKSEKLYEFISKEDLPEDFGGTRPSLSEHSKEVVAMVERRRQELMQENLWKADKKSKNNKADPSEVQSFRSLAID